MKNQQLLFRLLKSLAGQGAVLTVPRIFIDLTGDVVCALFLSQAIYWSDRGANSYWFYKSTREWEGELGISERQVRRVRKVLEDRGFIETCLRKANGAPTVHYHVDHEEVTKALAALLRSNGFVQGVQMDSYAAYKSLTETTTEISTQQQASGSREREGDGPVVASVSQLGKEAAQERLEKIGVEKAVAARLAEHYPPAHVIMAVTAAQTDPDVMDPPAWVVGCLTRGWQIQDKETSQREASLRRQARECYAGPGHGGNCGAFASGASAVCQTCAKFRR